LADKSLVGEKIDLLSLPAAERLRVCREIRAALRVRVAEVKVSLEDDAVVVDESVFCSSELEVSKKNEKSCDSLGSRKNASVLNSLIKRIW